MNQFPAGNAERILASQAQIDVAVDTETTLVIQAAQPLWADLSRLCFQAFSQSELAAEGSSPTAGDLNPLTRISSIQVRGAYELIRGSGAVSIPATFFGPTRVKNFAPLNGPRWFHLQSGEQVRITYTSAKAGFKSSVSAGIPVVLACDVGLQAIPASLKSSDGSAMIGCVAQTGATAGNKVDTTLTFALDEAGTMDVSHMVATFNAEETYAGAKNSNDPMDFTVQSQITSLKYIDSSEVIVGNSGGNTLAVPALMYGAPSGVLNRAHPWVLNQAQSGSAGSEVVLSVTSYSQQAAAGKIVGIGGAPFYAKGATGPGGTC